MRRAGTLIALAAALLAGGCASLSEQDCRAGDWVDVGRKDGTRGLPVDELEKHRDACKAHDITPDAKNYRRGHAEGLKLYCTPQGGYVAARRGEIYREVCPAGLQRPFLAAFRNGREVHTLLEEVRELRRRADEVQVAAMSGDMSPEQRTDLRFRAEEAKQRLKMKEWDLERLDRKYSREYGASELEWDDLRF